MNHGVEIRSHVTCEMAANCTHPVTHLGHKGYVYCTEHATVRRQSGYERCRQMTPWELRWVRDGKPLPSYERGPEPAEVADAAKAVA